MPPQESVTVRRSSPDLSFSLPHLSRRHQQVLQATVQHYVDTVEPVGSRTLVQRFGFQASPATVRSAMGALEQQGLLLQPHTSAGRIPSQRGYRLYVDSLLPPPGAGALQLEQELLGLSLRWAALDDLLLHLARRLADLTGLLSLITRPQGDRSALQAVRLVPSGDRLLVFLVENAVMTSCLNLHLPPTAAHELLSLERWVMDQLSLHPGQPIPWNALPPQLQRSGWLLREALRSHRMARPGDADGALALGLGGLLGQPEFSRTATLRPLVQLVEQDPHLLLQPDGVPSRGVWIGAENPHPALQDCALVQATYRTGDGSQGHVALVGPMRMAYATARAAVR